MFRGELSVGFMVGLDALQSLFQPKRFLPGTQGQSCDAPGPHRAAAVPRPRRGCHSWAGWALREERTTFGVIPIFCSTRCLCLTYFFLSLRFSEDGARETHWLPWEKLGMAGSRWSRNPWRRLRSVERDKCHRCTDMGHLSQHQQFPSPALPRQIHGWLSLSVGDAGSRTPARSPRRQGQPRGEEKAISSAPHRKGSSGRWEGGAGG